jgi:hypothetical protein
MARPALLVVVTSMLQRAVDQTDFDLLRQLGGSTYHQQHSWIDVSGRGVHGLDIRAMNDDAIKGCPGCP